MAVARLKAIDYIAGERSIAFDCSAIVALACMSTMKKHEFPIPWIFYLR